MFGVGDNPQEVKTKQMMGMMNDCFMFKSVAFKVMRLVLSK
jgi:hypothetical protein